MSTAEVHATGETTGLLRLRGYAFRCALGRGGIRRHKEEGDGATPAGLLPLRRVLYRADRLPAPACAVPVEPIGPQDGWCDDPADPAYNRPVRLPYAGRHEELWRGDSVYDIIGVLGWNDQPVVRERGSAIFLHLARPGFPPTEGCIALELADLRALLAMGLSGIEVAASRP
ncbi:L,D-transpeptidase family protein [Roseomonas marmotae]|uniref:L,D-transpeptidase family protein n=1 Tax=Roseomonas marmotae TaxID=2768161 RepID=A0ABS3KE95_9PROT|nr:L,D-transpeptidase family protein [Roseomonas marmotae]MBO1074973.1 L,D-transpeptidase family protein [Roseomonas marmotae]QTI79987.1 L,D-transpeptidase family protein [Roseomonas marmotae]